MSTPPDESYFVAAATEYDAGRARPALVVRVEAEADGDPARTRAGYIRARAAELAESAPPPVRGGIQVGRSRFSTLRGIAIVVVLITVVAVGMQLVQASRADQETTYAPVPDGLLVASDIPVPDPPMPVAVSVDCSPRAPRLRGNDIGSLLSSAIEAATEDYTVFAKVRVRNNGARGRIDVASVLRQSRAPQHVIRRETVLLEAGEEREIVQVYPEAVSGATSECQAWAVLPGAYIAGLETPPAPPAPQASAPRPREAGESDMYASPNEPQRSADEAFRSATDAGATQEEAEAASDAAYHDSYWGDEPPFEYEPPTSDM